MPDLNQIFHLAIACHDLQAAVNFYQEKLGCDRHRQYNDRVTFNFFEHQLVCHLAPSEIEQKPKMYPRHFGITFRNETEFQTVWQRALEREVPIFQKMNVRFKGRKEQHRTFFLIDPSNNLIEFKYYDHPEMMY